MDLMESLMISAAGMIEAVIIKIKGIRISIVKPLKTIQISKSQTFLTFFSFIIKLLSMRHNLIACAHTRAFS